MRALCAGYPMATTWLKKKIRGPPRHSLPNALARLVAHAEVSLGKTLTTCTHSRGLLLALFAARRAFRCFFVIIRLLVAAHIGR